MDRYIYSAIFEACEEGGYSITFHDLPGCITEGDTLEEALSMAKEVLSLHLWGMEDDNDEIPAPTPPEKIIINNKSFVVPIEVYMPPFRETMNNKAVKKTLTIPYWLNKAAEEKKLNFSQILQYALKEELGIKEKENFCEDIKKHIDGISFLQAASLDNESVKLEYKYENSNTNAVEYFETGDKINKILMETPFRIVRHYPTVNNVTVIISSSDKRYSIDITRNQIEKLLGFKMDIIKSNNDWREKISTKFFIKKIRSEFVKNYVKIKRIKAT